MAGVNIGQMTDEAKAAAQAAAKAANEKAGFSTEQQNAGTKLNADFNFFLRMLTTQLQNQDPSEPMDVSQMTQQITQFTQVEQQVATNTKLDTLLKSNAATVYQSQISTAAGYIGREIETKGNTGQVYGGQGAFSYILPAGVKEVQLTIKNEKGEVVFEGKGGTKTGRNVMLWDGRDSDNQEQQPDGIYTLTVKATDASGKAAAAETRGTWLVGGFEKDKDGNIMLNVDDKAVYLEDVLNVRPATRAVFEYPDEDEEGEGNDTTAGGGDDEVEETA